MKVESKFLMRATSKVQSSRIVDPQEYGGDDDNPVGFNDLKVGAKLLKVKIGKDPLFGYDPDAESEGWDAICKKYKVSEEAWGPEPWTKAGFKIAKTATVDGVKSTFLMKDDIVIVTNNDDALPIAFSKKEFK